MDCLNVARVFNGVTLCVTQSLHSMFVLVHSTNYKSREIESDQQKVFGLLSAAGLITYQTWTVILLLYK